MKPETSGKLEICKALAASQKPENEAGAQLQNSLFLLGLYYKVARSQGSEADAQTQDSLLCRGQTKDTEEKLGEPDMVTTGGSKEKVDWEGLHA